MRDDQIRRLLSLANPWWTAASTRREATAWTSSHRLLTKRRVFDLGYRSRVLDDVATCVPDDSLVVLNGPRRVGKSVVLLDTVATMCGRDDIDPRQLVHVPCDGMSDQDLRRVITLGRALTASVDANTSRPRVWFFDEISDIPGWTTVLKQARDLTDFGDDTVVATGSHWAGGENIYGNLMAGRAGTSGRRRIRQLLPMTFRDFAAATCPDLPLPAAVHPAELQTDEVRRALTDLVFLADEYDLAWQGYLTCGGFPRAAAEHTKTGAVSRAFVDDLVGWLRTDTDPEAPVESLPLLLAELADRATSPLNLRSTALALGCSRGVLDRRIARLTGSHAALRCHRRDEHGRTVPGAQYKLYLVDPVLAWAPSTISPGLDQPDFTQLNESVLAVALARRIDALDEGRWAVDDTIGYTRTESAEVDLAPVRVPTTSGSATTTPLESKWIDTGWQRDARVLQGKYGGGVLATKSVLDLTRAVWAVPAPLVALLLG
ncbi:MAG: AAA family ATPase [Micrococcales bacterium]|nr:AAA family ATPase [Micrococcales bacterium]